MKTSELIYKLNEAIEEHGDIDACIYSNDDIFTAETVYYDDEYNVIVIDN